mmetsp:Transcript_30247/g.58134  ORF Transcript_30247/g.58134 Transcript_30247/m.58134 type:complete len:212 (-) Transcript_30247:139-774(-)
MITAASFSETLCRCSSWGTSKTSSSARVPIRLIATKKYVQGRLARIGTGKKHPGAQMVVRALGGELEPLPPVSLDGVTPETRAANSLKTLFTMVAVGIVLDQMTGSRHRQPIYYDVVKYLKEHPIDNGHEWLSGLMKHEQPRIRMVAVRIIEVRKAFLDEFDWEQAQQLALDSMKADSLAFQRHLLQSTFDDVDGLDESQSAVDPAVEEAD